MIKKRNPPRWTHPKKIYLQKGKRLKTQKGISGSSAVSLRLRDQIVEGSAKKKKTG